MLSMEKNNMNTFLGGVSIFILSYFYFNYIQIKYQVQDENQRIILDSKQKCYQILIDTILEYKCKNIPNHYSFVDFMKQMWYKDYLIMIEQIKENNIHKHRYREWENIFNQYIHS